MDQYKKRLRIFAKRFGCEIKYQFDGGFLLQFDEDTLQFTPTSKTEMLCIVSRAGESFEFVATKSHIFDIVHRFFDGRPLDGYTPKGEPLSLQEYIDEEGAEPRLERLKRDAESGVAENGELGGNHYNVELFENILIVFDIFTGAPTNVIELADAKLGE